MTLNKNREAAIALESLTADEFNPQALKSFSHSHGRFLGIDSDTLTWVTQASPKDPRLREVYTGLKESYAPYYRSLRALVANPFDPEELKTFVRKHFDMFEPEMAERLLCKEPTDPVLHSTYDSLRQTYS